MMTKTILTTGNDADKLELEIQRIQSMAVADLRVLWSKTFKRLVLKALTRDLLVRTLAWHIQEQAYGGHDRATLKILQGYARPAPGDGKRPRYLKPGTEVVREYQGERHTVVITTEGFRWRDGDYPSLTAISRAITGTSCNGPRFFGLRVSGEGAPAGVAEPSAAGRQKPPKDQKRAGGVGL